MTAQQLSLLDYLDQQTPAARRPLTAAERQQHDWIVWLQDAAGGWCCPACGEHETSAELLLVRHGWHTDLSKPGHPYPYSWPGTYAEGGWIGNGGRCLKLRAEWLDRHYPTRRATA